MKLKLNMPIRVFLAGGIFFLVIFGVSMVIAYLYSIFNELDFPWRQMAVLAAKRASFVGIVGMLLFSIKAPTPRG